MLEGIEQRPGVVGGAQQVDAQVGADRTHGDSVDLGDEVGMLVLGQAGGLDDRVGLGAEQRDQSALQGSLVQLQVVAEFETTDHVEEVLERHALGVEQELVAGIEDPQVSEHLALRGQKGRVAPPARGQRLNVIGDLTLEEGLGLGPRQRELAALGTVEHPAGDDDRLVLVSRDLNRSHGSEHRPSWTDPRQV